mmetsp:Transcript_39315/g.78581  ORF Transcript_39315/g.78581 Transcript_39315/m.78581 type:complete len:144 (+) Transcript_39315:306-737(+)
MRCHPSRGSSLVSLAASPRVLFVCCSTLCSQVRVVRDLIGSQQSLTHMSCLPHRHRSPSESATAPLRKQHATILPVTVHLVHRFLTLAAPRFPPTSHPSVDGHMRRTPASCGASSGGTSRGGGGGGWGRLFLEEPAVQHVGTP